MIHYNSHSGRAFYVDRSPVVTKFRSFISEGGGDLPAPYDGFTVQLTPAPFYVGTTFKIYHQGSEVSFCSLILKSEAFRAIWPCMKRQFRSPSGTLPKFVSDALSGKDETPWIIVDRALQTQDMSEEELKLLEELEIGIAYALLDEAELV